MPGAEQRADPVCRVQEEADVLEVAEQREVDPERRRQGTLDVAVRRHCARSRARRRSRRPSSRAEAAGSASSTTRRRRTRRPRGRRAAPSAGGGSTSRASTSGRKPKMKMWLLKSTAFLADERVEQPVHVRDRQVEAVVEEPRRAAEARKRRHVEQREPVALRQRSPGTRAPAGGARSSRAARAPLALPGGSA